MGHWKPDQSSNGRPFDYWTAENVRLSNVSGFWIVTVPFYKNSTN